MARLKTKPITDGKNYLNLWEAEYKPEILKYHQVPIDLAAKALGVSVDTVQSQLRSGLYDYGVARPCSGGSYRYEILPLRFIKFVEGDLNSIKHMSYGTED